MSCTRPCVAWPCVACPVDKIPSLLTSKVAENDFTEGPTKENRLTAFYSQWIPQRNVAMLAISRKSMRRLKNSLPVTRASASTHRELGDSGTQDRRQQIQATVEPALL